jgi:flagellar biogenesis protein FliO
VKFGRVNIPRVNIFLSAALLIGLSIGVGRVRADAVAATQDTSALDSQPILRDGTTDGDSAKAKPISSSLNSFDPTRVLLALGAVIGLILLLRWGVKKMVPGVAASRSTQAMKVLSRCVVSPRQRLLLVQVGNRLVVVGDGGSQLNPLCQITDAEEVSALLAQVREESTTIAARFDSIFGRAKKGFGGDEEEGAAPKEPEAESGNDESEAEAATDETIVATRDELAGLSNKVRDLAKQLGRA